MSTGPEDFRPKRRELALPDNNADAAAYSNPKWDFNSIVGDARAPRADVSRFRSVGPQVLRDSHSLPLYTDRLTLTAQLNRTLKRVRESSENPRRPGQVGRDGETAEEREQAERKNQQVKTAEVAKKAKAMIALLKSNPDAVAKLAAIADSSQGQGFGEVFASILLDKSADKPEQEMATKAATQLAAANPEFAQKLGKALIQQDTTNQQLAQVLSAPENKVLLDAVVQTALAEPAKAENIAVLQELAKVEPSVATNPKVAEVITAIPQTVQAAQVTELPQTIQLASLDVANLDLGSRALEVAPNVVTTAQVVDATMPVSDLTLPVADINLSVADTTIRVADLAPLVADTRSFVSDATPILSSYTFSAELPQRIESLRAVINAPTFNPTSLEVPFKEAVQAEVYSNRNANIEQIRDGLSTKLGITPESKFTLEIQTSANERVLALVPTQATMQEKPEMAAVRIPAFSESEIQSAKVEIQKLDKFIADINTNTEVSVASRFADFARNSSNSLNTVLAFRQVIMTMAKGSNVSGRELAQKVKEELNVGLAGSNLMVSTEADSILLNTISESLDSSSVKTLASVPMEEAPAGSLTTGQIEQLKTAMVSALNDPFKLALLEQKLLQNGVMQGDIDSLKTRAFESGDVNQVITDASAQERIRKDLSNLVSYNREDRILAAEDLRLNNIKGLSVAGGEVGFSLDQKGTETSVKVTIPGQQADEAPISIEMFAYGGYDHENRENERMEELADAFMPLDYNGLPIQVMDKLGNKLSLAPQLDYGSGYGEAGVSEDENMYTDEQPVDPNFNPFDYIQLQPAISQEQFNYPQDQYPQQDYPQEDYGPEQGSDFEQEFDQTQDQYQEYSPEIAPEVPPEIPQEYSDFTNSVQPNLLALFSNDMARRVTAAAELVQNGVEVYLETSSGVVQLIAKQSVNEISHREMYQVRLQDVNNPSQSAVIAEVELENGRISPYTPPAPPSINLIGAKITYKYNGQTFSVRGEELR